MTEPALDRRSVLPLYDQLKQWSAEKIDSGDIKAGDRIPTEQETCRQMGLSRGTVRAALSNLVPEGRLYMVRGRGTYVAHYTPQCWSLGSFVSISDAPAQQGHTFERRVLDLNPTSLAPVYLLDDLAYEAVELPAEARPVEYSQTIIRGDRHRFEIQSVQVGPSPD